MNLSDQIQQLAEHPTAPIIQPQAKDREYIVVSDITSEVLLSTHDRYEAQKFAGKIRRAGGCVTIFKAMEI